MDVLNFLLDSKITIEDIESNIAKNRKLPTPQVQQYLKFNLLDGDKQQIKPPSIVEGGYIRKIKKLKKKIKKIKKLLKKKFK
jgi:hypothetical protein